jgi:hypothetical protein
LKELSAFIFKGLRNEEIKSSLNCLLPFGPDCYVLASVLLCCGCAVWSVTLREEHRLRVFGNRVLKEMFRTEREEVARNWRTLQHEELRALRCSPDLIRAIK